MTMTATNPTTNRAADDDLWKERVEAACRLLEANDEGVPALADVAADVGASPDALRRAFVRLLGVTPRKYADTLRRARLRDALRDGDDVSRALYTAGYGSTSRLYEGAHEHLGMTPASYRAGGAGTRVLFTVAETSLGALLVAVTDRGLCKVDLADKARTVEESLHHEFHAADIRRDDAALAPVVDDVVARIDGRIPTIDLPLDVRGTAFQRAVWEELRRIPAGETRTYAEVAEAIGAPRASRAVGSACGANPVPIVVPCHRVVPSAGGVGNYGLGPHRKEELLRREGALEAVEQARPAGR
jgi:AraC family transcriptional regulator, regulatory protein of adaptative response / methylated-DNA-[protein]-cysteine methyltransferase